MAGPQAARRGRWKQGGGHVPTAQELKQLLAVSVVLNHSLKLFWPTSFKTV